MAQETQNNSHFKRLTKMIKLIIEVEAKDLNGIENSVKEALKWIEKGYNSGRDINDDESYSFQVTGEEEPIDEQS